MASTENKIPPASAGKITPVTVEGKDGKTKTIGRALLIETLFTDGVATTTVFMDLGGKLVNTVIDKRKLEGLADPEPPAKQMALVLESASPKVMTLVRFIIESAFEPDEIFFSKMWLKSAEFFVARELIQACWKIMLGVRVTVRCLLKE